MTSVLHSVTNWLGGTREVSPERVEISLTSDGQILEQSIPVVTAAPEKTSDKATEGNGSTEEVADMDESELREKSSLEVDLQEVSEKAMTAAKEWGSYLYSFGKAASEQVAKTAKQLKESVEEKTILGEFVREQDKFVTGIREKKKLSEAAVPPWVGYNEEELMKTQILGLSKEKRNFLRNPPTGIQFNFDYESSYPVALVMLDEDPNLESMRFELVPKQIQEEIFWRNYFYRVSLIKQSTQLTSLAQQTGSTSSKKSEKGGLHDSVDAIGPSTEEVGVGVGGSSGLEHEFVSDTFQAGDIDDAELQKEMHQLGMTNKLEESIDAELSMQNDLPEWEKELQAELQEYEVVDDGTTDADDAYLEQEIMKQIEAEVKENATQ